MYAAIEQTVKALILKERDSLRGRTVISFTVQAVATSEILEPGSHLIVVGIDDCSSISVYYHRQISTTSGNFITGLSILDNLSCAFASVGGEETI